MKEKKILLISSEMDLTLMINLSKLFKENGFDADVIISDRWNLMFRYHEVRKELSNAGLDLKNFDLYNELYLNLNNNRSSFKIDWNYISSFENKYNNFLSLNHLLRTDFAVSTDFHDCSLYYFPKDSLLKYYFLQLHLKFVESIFENNYDLFFSFGTQGIIKSLLFKVASSFSDKKYYVLEENRISNRWQLYSNFTINTDPAVLSEMSLLSKSKNSCNDAISVIDNYVGSNDDSLYERHSLELRKNKVDIGILRLFYYLSWTLKGTYFIYKSRIRYSKIFHSDLAIPNIYTNIKFYLENYFRLNWYLNHKKLNVTSLPDRNFIFFALHLMPESNTAIQSKILDEITCIKQLILKIPSDWLIVVKLHPSMFTLSGYTRSREFFKKLLEIPGVVVFSPYYSSKALIQNSRAVASLAGTVLLEAAMYDKIGIYWGDPEFSIIDSLVKIENFNVKTLDNKNNFENLKLYIQSCLNLSTYYEKKFLVDPVKHNSPFYSKYIKINKNLEKFLLKYIN